MAALNLLTLDKMICSRRLVFRVVTSMLLVSISFGGCAPPLFPPGDQPPPQLKKLATATDNLWAKLLKQIEAEAKAKEFTGPGPRGDLKDWIPSLERLQKTDQDLFNLLDGVLDEHDRRQADRFIYSIGLLELSQSASRGTDTETVIRVLIKINNALDQVLQDGGWLGDWTKWPRKIFKTKNDILGNILEIRSKGHSREVK